MSVPPGYRPLTPETVPAWLDAHPALRARVPGAHLHVREVGDGNLNLVFIVRDDPDRPGIVLKQSLPWVRVFGEGWPLTLERARHEADAYAAYQGFAGRVNPDYHGFDAPSYVLAMEDLADLAVWRTALNDGGIHAGAAADLGRFVARIALHTSDLGLAPDEKKRRVAATTNPELCRITEDLVLTDPYVEHERNRHDPALDGAVAELRADGALRLAAAELKHRFVTAAEAHIHGDLHTGSVMVGGGRAVAIDPEFAFYGPVGFDLGNLWANAVFAAARGDRLGRSAAFRAHVAAIVSESWAAFTGELRALWPARHDPFYPDAFLDAWLARIHADAVGYMGTELIRRIVGFAHVSDIDSLEPPARESAAGACLRAGRRLVLGRAALGSPEAAWAVAAEESARG
ncbi:MAG: S-methyl-5-thioribose kinase [Chloroflexota bacterium]